MSNQIVISSGAKLRNLDGVITGASGILSSVPLGGADGVATLDSLGKVPVSQLPNSVMEYKGTWDVSTNTPYLVNGTGNAGDVYLVTGASTDGTLHDFGSGAILFFNGDQAIYDGSAWQRGTGATGTVTSVSVTESGDALSITGSPITTSGTINIGFAGTSAQYVAGDGSLITFPSLTGYVPYTGATANLNLGTYGLLGDFVEFNTSPSSVPTSVGTMYWDSFYKTPQVITGTGNTNLQIGQEEVILIHNNTGSTLTDGQVVYITGSTGELPSVSLASASSEATSSATLGVVTETIANGADGFVTTSGLVHGLNTNAYTEGDLLWLGTTAGTFTTTKPTSPNHLVLIGYVIKKSGGNGSILVKIQNTQELDECSDVLFTSLTNNDIMYWQGSSSLWKNASIPTILGYTPANQSLVVPYTGATTNVDLGTNNLTAYSLIVNGNGSTQGNSLIFKQYNSAAFGGVGTTSIYALGMNTINFALSQGAPASVKSFTFNTDNISVGVVGYYYLPASSGTLALTSQLTGGTVTSVGLSSSTSGVTIGSSPITTSGTITLSIATASGSQQGLLSSTDWTTFNNKISTSGTIPNGTLVKLSSGSLVASDILNSTSGLVAVTGTVFVTGNFVKSGGTSSQFLKADGSVDSNTYLTTSSASSTYLPLSGGTLTGGLSGTSATFSGQLAIGGQSNIYGGLSGLYALQNGNSSYYSYDQETGVVGNAYYNSGWKYKTSNYASRYLQNVGIHTWFTATSGTADGSLSWSEKMRLTNDGNVGIGTTSPDSYLSTQLVVSAPSFGGITIASTNTSNTNYLCFARGTTSNLPYIGSISYNHTSDFMAFATNGSERMRITSAGNVGIGTSSPISGGSLARWLTIDGTLYGGGVISSVNGAAQSYTYYDNTTTLHTIQAVSGVGIGFQTSNTERMRITSGGKVLIGTSSASTGAGGFGANSLQVNNEVVSMGSLAGVFFENRSGGVTSTSNWGGWYWTGTSTNLYNGSANIAAINMSTGIYVALSDSSKKKDFEQSTIGLNAILGLKPTLYRMKSDNDNAEKTLGFIAQEVKEFIPQAYVEEGDFIGLNDRPILAALVKAIQELKLEIDELKNK